MSATSTYPGVYIEEIPSGVRTITGVSTSVTAFVGTAKRGPINRAVRVLSYSDFERRFGGLSADSELSYAVRQFFLNGGSDAWVVRLAGSSTPASRELLDSGSHHVLRITALDEGFSGNRIQVEVGYDGSASSFRLSLSYSDPANPQDAYAETFASLSLNSNHPRYVESVVNGSSKLVSVERIAATPLLTGLSPGTSTSGFLTTTGDASGTLVDVFALIDSDHNQLRVSMDGQTPVTVQVDTTGAVVSTLNDKLDWLCTTITSQVSTKPGYGGFTCAADGAKKRIIMTSGSGGENSYVTVFPGITADLSARLKLGALAGGTEVESAAAIRPVEIPALPETYLEGGTEIPVNPSNVVDAYLGSLSDREGIYALEAVDIFNILCLPGISEPAILIEAAKYCKDRRAFLLVDVPPDTLKPEDMSALLNPVPLVQLPKSDHAAVYYPWIQIADPLNNGKARLTAPSGAVAGLYARTDSTRGVWKAPAGTEAALSALGVAYTLTDGENGTLNPKGVNCIRNLPVYGTVAWGARTLMGDDAMTSEWKYVPVRRLALYLEESLYRGTQWVVFEPNDEPLWSQIRLNIGAFMHTLFRQGAFQGASPREAYLVKCDKETTTQDDINRGVVNILVAFAPLKPAEFVVIKIQQKAGQIQA
jgi:phage tail sheath protein FI